MTDNAPEGEPIQEAASRKRQKATEAWYRQYYRKQGGDRNDLFGNPEVLFQTLALDAAVITALRSTRLDPGEARVLDVGCGTGGSLINFLRLGFKPSNIYGIDILEDRIAMALARFPSVNLYCGDASSMKFADDIFDLVFESTMFVQITEEGLAAQIAREMLRVAKPGGHIVLVDWRYGKPSNASYKAVSQRRIAQLFRVGSRSRVCGAYKGALVPPVGRFLSRHMPFMYFGVQVILPFLVGQMITVLRKV